MSEQRQPRIGVIGTGAIGGFYGLMLARAGFEVHFLLRSEYAAVKRDGLRINSVVHGELVLPVVNAWQDVVDMPACDWLLVAPRPLVMLTLLTSSIRRQGRTLKWCCCKMV